MTERPGGGCMGSARLGPTTTAWLFVMLVACGGDCSCRQGCGQGGIDPAQGRQPQPAGGPPGASTAGVTQKATQAAGQPAAAGSAGTGALPGPGSSGTASEAPKLLGELVDRPTLRAVLPATVGGLRAPGPVMDGLDAHERSPVRQVARRYKQGSRDLYVEVTDTAQAPELRANVQKMLTDPSALQAPERHDFSLAGSPAVTTGFPAQRASGVVALVGGRYFVNARLEGTEDMGEAARLLQAMDLSALATPDGAAGHGAQ